MPGISCCGSSAKDPIELKELESMLGSKTEKRLHYPAIEVNAIPVDSVVLYWSESGNDTHVFHSHRSPGFSLLWIGQKVSVAGWAVSLRLLSALWLAVLCPGLQPTMFNQPILAGLGASACYLISNTSQPHSAFNEC